ncbi:hypothetical protein F5972_06455 [Microbispora cellulosiformans]|uniref:Uncharacterized protein n=1 Tax=Microbispora cellulosiformans TaxID=2614688 RepID=A0A5J5KAZ1_9ACTN|nr:hypothetical protein [Microbispora cellulosiformans]KAA9380742.1 hypothetical protein F5972_06455 [Microbispora cellulosiformans]
MNPRTAATTLVTLTSAVTGAILGAVVQGLLESPTQIMLAALGLVSILTLTVISILTAREHAVDVAVNRLERQVTDLKEQSGMRVNLQHAEKIKRFTDLKDDPVTQLLLGAKRSILILDYISRTGEWPDEDINKDHMRKHHESVIKHVRASRPPIEYRRICQVEMDDTGQSSRMLLEPFERAQHTEAHDHYVAMLKLSQELVDSTMISIRVAAQRYPYKFIIVDGQSIVLSLQHFDQHRNLHLWSELIVEDAKAALLEVFMRIWRDLENRSIPFKHSESGDGAAAGQPTAGTAGLS